MGMKTFSKRELNQQTAHVLAEVTTGESVVVTDRGVPKWRIEALEAHPDPVERLRIEGRVTPAKKHPRAWTTHREAQRYTPAEVDALLDETRGDR
jgi:antitoxin (DNA-binding transcriptional repressor) of toxin-antitoxin stability system